MRGSEDETSVNIEPVQEEAHTPDAAEGGLTALGAFGCVICHRQYRRPALSGCYGVHTSPLS